MANLQEVEASILALLPEQGEMQYTEFVQQMNESGLGQYTNRVPLMKKRGALVMRVAHDGQGISFTVRKGEG